MSVTNLARFLASTVVFCLLLISYFVIIQNTISVPFFIFGILKSSVRAVQGRELSPQEHATIARISSLFSIILLLVLAIAIVGTTLSQQAWFRFWVNPVLLAVYILIALHQVGHLKGYNPILRPVAGFSLFTGWAVSLTVFVAVLWPSLFQENVVKWASFIASCLSILAHVLGIKSLSMDIFRFESLDNRHDHLGENLEQLRHIANVLGDMDRWVEVRETFTAAEQAYREALDALRHKRLDAAENAIIRGEAEVEGLYNLISDRLSLSLKDEIRARLEQAERDCQTLKEEFGDPKFSAVDITELEREIQEWKERLDSITFVSEPQKLAEQIQPFEELFERVITIRTALRLRANVNASLDNIKAELLENEAFLKIAEAIGMDISALSRRQEALREHLRLFQAQLPTSVEDLLERYRLLRQTSSELKAAKNALSMDLKRLYTIQTLFWEDVTTTIFIPKYISTKEAASGVIVLKPQRIESSSIKPLSCTLDGVLLEMQQRQSFQLKVPFGERYAITSFSFIGKRGGIGKLAVYLKQDDLEQQYNFTVVVGTPVSETAREAFLFATPMGGVGVLLAWYFFRNIVIAGTLGIAVGGAITLFILLLQRLQMQQREKAFLKERN